MCVIFEGVLNYLFGAVTCKGMSQVSAEGAFPNSSFSRQHQDLVLDWWQFFPNLGYSCGRTWQKRMARGNISPELYIYATRIIPNICGIVCAGADLCFLLILNNFVVKSYQGREPWWHLKHIASGLDNPGMQTSFQLADSLFRDSLKEFNRHTDAECLVYPI